MPLNAGHGILGAIGSFGAGQDAAYRQNEQLVRQYKQQLKNRKQRDWAQRTGVYAQKLGVYDQTIKNNAKAASLAQGRNQQRLMM